LIELATEFIPPASEILSICDENIGPALMVLNRVSYSTLTGHITDYVTWETIQAEIFVEGVDDTGDFRYPITSNEEFGTYYRMLTEGVYDVTYSAYGYIPLTIENIVIDSSDVTVVDAVLTPETTLIEVTGTVINGDSGEPIENAVVEIQDHNIPFVTTNFYGEYSIPDLFPYTYELLVYADSMTAFEGNITISEEQNEIDFELYELDDGTFETGEFNVCWQFHGQADWIIEESVVYEGSNSARSGPLDIDEYSDMSVTIYVAEEDEISFYVYTSCGIQQDFLRFFIDDQIIDQWTGYDPWELVSYPVAPGVHTFKWSYCRDWTTPSGYDCAFLDNITLPSSAGVFVEEIHLPTKSKLYANYPNPFNPSTTISYSLKENSKVSLIIYNIKGQKVKDLSPSLCHTELVEVRGESRYSAVWNGKDDNNKQVSSGIYLYKLKTDNFEKTKKMILLK